MESTEEKPKELGLFERPIILACILCNLFLTIFLFYQYEKISKAIERINVLENKKQTYLRTLSENSDGTVEYSVNSNNPALTIGLDYDGGYINTYSAEAKNMVSISSLNRTYYGTGLVHGTIRTYSDKGTNLVDVSATETGNGYIGTYSDKGEKRVSISATDSGGYINTYSAEAKAMVSISSYNGTDLDHGTIRTYSDKGENLVSISATDSGGYIRTYSDKGESRISIAAFDAGGAIVIYTKDRDYITISGDCIKFHKVSVSFSGKKSSRKVKEICA